VEPAVDEPVADAGSRTLASSRLALPVREFIATQNATAVVLLAATVAALVWANSPWAASYERLWETELSLGLGHRELALDLRHWVNDGLMALFFFTVGLEIRRELDMGDLREHRRVATPVVAAVGGMVVPALLYLAFNAGEPTARGWGIAMGTDTAFSLAMLSLVGRSAPPRARTFLLTLLIIDDIVALTVIAVAYTSGVSLTPLLVAVALFAVVLAMKRARVRNGVPYFLVGAAIWLATLASGVHATVAGVVLGVLASAYPPSRDELERVGARWRLFREQPTPQYARSASRSLAVAISPNERLQHLFHPWTSFVIVPIFALANAGVELSAEALRDALSSRVTLGIVVGLVVGKPLGILAASWLFSRGRLGGFPLTVPWPPLVGTATVAGIGFTVSLLIADISFTGAVLEEAKLGILAASVVASILGLAVFRLIGRLPDRLVAAGVDRLAAPLVDLAQPVDPDVDHVRGPSEAPVTLVEYGDFECPYCGRAEPVIRELVATFGRDLRFVFRHLPLTDVHEHAQQAAEAAEAAGAQGRFWEMHDRLLARQSALDHADLELAARELGLDVDRFVHGLDERRYALRVLRDVESADASGAAGTPTFFINGHRHDGPYDLASLTAAIARELEADRVAAAAVRPVGTAGR
jgi:Na+/H+ antiporter NhaA